MKRFIIKLALLSSLCLSFILVSCDGEPCPCNANRTIDAGTEQFLTIKLAAPNSVTLRAATTEVDPMLTAEKLRFLFYKGEAGSETLAQVIERSFTNTMQDGFQLKLIPDDYKLVVIANPSAKLEELTSLGASLTNLIEAKKLATTGFMSPNNDKVEISMANEQGVVTVQKSDFHPTKTLTTGLTATEVRLEPMLARVLVFGQPELNGSQPTGLKAQYLINNLASSVAPLRPFNKLSSNTMEQSGDNSAKTERYASSTLWTKWENNVPTDTELINSFTKELFAKSTLWTEMQISIDAYKPLLSKTFQLYAKETTLPSKAYLKGLTPCVVIKYPFVPKGLNTNGTEGWLSYNGHLYTETEAKNILKATDNQANPLKVAMTTAGITEQSFNEGFSKDGIKFYHQSYNYYVVYIRHFANAKEKDAYGRYGIVRANEYQIEIKSIQDAGLPIAPIMKGNLEPVPEHESKGLKVIISELTHRNQEVSL